MGLTGRMSNISKSQKFNVTISRFATDLQTLPKNVWAIRQCLSRVVEFCDKHTHTRTEDLDEEWRDRKDYYNLDIGWTIPSWDMLMQIKSVQQQRKKPVCDYGAGSGLLTHLLKLVGCDVYGVDLNDGWKNVGKFHGPEILISETGGDHPSFVVPNDHIFLISWGYLNVEGSPLNDYIERGGRCVIIIGEDDDGCTYPSYEYLKGQKEWQTHIIEVPNFHGIHTRMSINIRP